MTRRRLVWLLVAGLPPLIVAWYYQHVLVGVFTEQLRAGVIDGTVTTDDAPTIALGAAYGFLRALPVGFVTWRVIARLRRAWRLAGVPAQARSAGRAGWRRRPGREAAGLDTLGSSFGEVPSS
jgi:hypothetical protein